MPSIFRFVENHQRFIVQETIRARRLRALNALPCADEIDKQWELPEEAAIPFGDVVLGKEEALRLNSSHFEVLTPLSSKGTHSAWATAEHSTASSISRTSSSLILSLTSHEIISEHDTPSMESQEKRSKENSLVKVVRRKKGEDDNEGASDRGRQGGEKRNPIPLVGRRGMGVGLEKSSLGSRPALPPPSPQHRPSLSSITRNVAAEPCHTVSSTIAPTAGLARQVPKGKKRTGVSTSWRHLLSSSTTTSSAVGRRPSLLAAPSPCRRPVKTMGDGPRSQGAGKELPETATSASLSSSSKLPLSTTTTTTRSRPSTKKKMPLQKVPPTSSEDVATEEAPSFPTTREEDPRSPSSTREVSLPSPPATSAITMSDRPPENVSPFPSRSTSPAPRPPSASTPAVQRARFSATEYVPKGGIGNPRRGVVRSANASSLTLGSSSLSSSPSLTSSSTQVSTFVVAKGVPITRGMIMAGLLENNAHRTRLCNEQPRPVTVVGCPARHWKKTPYIYFEEDLWRVVEESEKAPEQRSEERETPVQDIGNEKEKPAVRAGEEEDHTCGASASPRREGSDGLSFPVSAPPSLFCSLPDERHGQASHDHHEEQDGDPAAFPSLVPFPSLEGEGEPREGTAVPTTSTSRSSSVDPFLRSPVVQFLVRQVKEKRPPLIASLPPSPEGLEIPSNRNPSMAVVSQTSGTSAISPGDSGSPAAILPARSTSLSSLPSSSWYATSESQTGPTVVGAGGVGEGVPAVSRPSTTPSFTPSFKKTTTRQPTDSQTVEGSIHDKKKPYLDRMISTSSSSVIAKKKTSTTIPVSSVSSFRSSSNTGYLPPPPLLSSSPHPVPSPSLLTRHPVSRASLGRTDLEREGDHAGACRGRSKALSESLVNMERSFSSVRVSTTSLQGGGGEAMRQGVEIQETISVPEVEEPEPPSYAIRHAPTCQAYGERKNRSEKRSRRDSRRARENPSMELSPGSVGLHLTPGTTSPPHVSRSRRMAIGRIHPSSPATNTTDKPERRRAEVEDSKAAFSRSKKSRAIHTNPSSALVSPPLHARKMKHRLPEQQRREIEPSDEEARQGRRRRVGSACVVPPSDEFGSRAKSFSFGASLDWVLSAASVVATGATATAVATGTATGALINPSSFSSRRDVEEMRSEHQRQSAIANRRRRSYEGSSHYSTRHSTAEGIENEALLFSSFEYPFEEIGEGIMLTAVHPPSSAPHRPPWKPSLSPAAALVAEDSSTNGGVGDRGARDTETRRQEEPGMHAAPQPPFTASTQSTTSSHIATDRSSSTPLTQRAFKIREPHRVYGSSRYRKRKDRMEGEKTMLHS